MQGNLAVVTLEHFADDGGIPNNVLPVVIYKGALSAPSAEAMEALFDGNGWPSAWRWSVYDFHHYHSRTHECLGVAQGSARLQLGGEGGRVFAVEAGDVVVLPAGTGHKKLSASGDFLVVGAYPPGCSADLLRGEHGERPGADERIAQVPLPQTDPVGGQAGPVLAKWG
ncbi:cupin domain-containing protein [Devosia sp. XK-2]|uniref:cupin domain-containing protein n=1 Tax=Devosia sp. XK-2 TaxID=3126689 RepID=UPI0030D56381